MSTALVLWLWVKTRVHEVECSDPSTGLAIFTLYCCKNWNVCLKKTKSK